MRISARSILVAGYVVFVLYAYPGFMTTASVDQLVDARVGSFTDWSPPVMTELWRLLGFVIAGPAALLLLQGALLLLGAYALLREHWEARAAAVAAVIVLVFPPILATEAVIWPQSLLASCGIAAAAVLGARDRRYQLAAIPLVFVGCSLGSGAAVALLPVVVVRCAISRGWRRYAAALAVWAVLAIAAWAANQQLVDRATHRDELALAMADVRGTLHAAGSAPHAPIDAWLQQPDAHVDELVAARDSLRRDEPRAYLHYRATVAVRVLGLKRPHDWLPAYSHFLGDSAQLASTSHLARKSSVQRLLGAAVNGLSRTLLFHPYVYALLAIVLLPLAVGWRARDAAMLLAAGIAGELAMLVTAQEPQLRYSLWLIVTTVLAIPLLVAARLRTAP